jgi:rod shape-determining protein MreD
MGILAAIPVLIITAIVQVVIASRLQLLHGSVDLMMLVLVSWSLQEKARYSVVWALLGGILISIFSAVLPGVIIAGYVTVTLVTRLFQRRIWQMPILALLVMCFLGTIMIHFLTLISLQIGGTNLDFMEALRLVTMPSALLNLLLAVPVYTLVTDLVNFLYPAEVEA